MYFFTGSPSYIGSLKLSCFSNLIIYRIVSTITKSILLSGIRQPMLVQISQIIVQPGRIIDLWHRLIFVWKHVNWKHFMISDGWVDSSLRKVPSNKEFFKTSCFGITFQPCLCIYKGLSQDNLTRFYCIFGTFFQATCLVTSCIFLS